MIGLLEFAHIIHSKEKLVDFLIEHRVLASTITCTQCGNNLSIDKETLSYRCNKRYMIKNVHKKRVFKQCWYLVRRRIFLAASPRSMVEDTSQR